MPIFDTKSLDSAVAAALGDHGPDPTHRNAFVLLATTDGGAKGAYVHRFGDDWNVETYLETPDWHKLTGGVKVDRTW